MATATTARSYARRILEYVSCQVMLNRPVQLHESYPAINLAAQPHLLSSLQLCQRSSAEVAFGDLPLIVLLTEHRTHQSRTTAASFGKMPTTLVLLGSLRRRES